MRSREVGSPTAPASVIIARAYRRERRCRPSSGTNAGAQLPCLLLIGPIGPLQQRGIREQKFRQREPGREVDMIATRCRSRTAASGGTGHTILISEAPPRLSPGTRREPVTRGGPKSEQGAQKNPDAPCQRVKVPDSAYRVRGAGDRREGVWKGRWRGEAHPSRVTQGLVSDSMERANAMSF